MIKKMSYNWSIQLMIIASGMTLSTASMALDYDCLMEPHRVVEVKSEVEGRIESISFDRSDFVKAGDPLVMFESSVEKAAVELARAKANMTAELDSSEVSHEFAARKLSRFGDLAKQGVVADQTRDEVQTEESLAKLQIMQARENRKLAELELARVTAVLERHTITSPFDGVVVERFKSEGEYPDNDPIMTLAQLDPLNVEVLLPASRFGSIEPGMRATVSPEAPLEGNYSATVKIVDRVVDASSGTFGVRLELPNPDNKLPGGLRCTVSFGSQGTAPVSRSSRVVGSADVIQTGDR
jgi:RND family efflux transporter MFP subunit